ncbi:retrovirus-related pol polyprotein from transposon TNT 1-94 [Tanacetum coccineum]|uniref:Retrovirus-related pol polyprotein from transposon TNT 1-94 n=1 Tax=Tanacetum coccineum TaxID=301880 RepID=A0ABQ5AW81_9ASTR
MWQIHPPLNIQSTHQTPTQVPTVTAPENIIQAETNTENAQFDKDEFINIFSTPVQEQGETSNPPIPFVVYYKTKLSMAQEILKKHGMTSCDSIGTPMATKHLDADLSGTPVDQTKYRSMVGALMYLTASRPDIIHQHVIVLAIKRNRLRNISLRLSGSFGTLKTPLTWVSAGQSKEQDATSMYSQKSEYVSFILRVRTSSMVETQLKDLASDFDKYLWVLLNSFFVGTELSSDLFTKALSEDRFKYLVKRLDMRCLTPDELEVLAIESA